MSEELNCSEGARMLIERMQTHLDEFKVGGRFYWITEKMRGNAPRGHNELSDRDAVALTAAIDQYILEPWLTETVVDEIFNGDKRREEEKQNALKGYTANLAASMMASQNQIASGMLGTWSDPRMALQGGLVNPAQGQVLWTEQEKPKAGRDWFEHEKRILREMTDRTLAKLKRKPK
jgi:hypothetical protein